MEDKKIKCYSYIRVSTEMQVDGYSLDAQRDRLRKYADYQGMEIVREYCDAGKSGKSINGRVEFTKMLEDITSLRDEVSFVLVFKLSRFGRNAADVLSSLQLIQDYDVNLVCVEDGIDSSKESGKLTITVLSAVAEIERENILVQTMEGRKQKAREGKWNGGSAPFGYTVDTKKGVLVINPDEVDAVKKIFDLYANTDMRPTDIATYLNEHGYVKNKNRNFENSEFYKALIINILDNPVYTGKIAYGRTTTKKVKGTRDEYKRVMSDDYLLFDGAHPAIINEETWKACRVKRSEVKKRWVPSSSVDNHEHLLTGLIKCPCCGDTMRGMISRYPIKKKNEYKDTFYYRCNNKLYKEDGKKCDFKSVLPQIETNAEVENIVLGLINDNRFNSYVIKELKNKTNSFNLEKEREGLKEQLSQAEASKKKLMEQIDKLDINDRHYDRKHTDLQNRLDVIYDRINELDYLIIQVSKRIENAIGLKVTEDYIYRVLANFNVIYNKMTDLEKRQFFNDFIKSIEIYPEKRKDGKRIKSIEFKIPIENIKKGSKRDTIDTLNDKFSNPQIDLKIDMEDYRNNL